MEKNNTDEQKSISLSPKKEKKWPKPHHGKQERTRNENPSFHNSKKRCHPQKHLHCQHTSVTNLHFPRLRKDLSFWNT